MQDEAIINGRAQRVGYIVPGLFTNQNHHKRRDGKKCQKLYVTRGDAKRAIGLAHPKLKSYSFGQKEDVQITRDNYDIVPVYTKM